MSREKNESAASASGVAEAAAEAAPKAPSVSVLRKRLRKFRSLKRGYYSFVILSVLYILSFFLPLLMNSKALVVKYHGEYYFPLNRFYPGKQFDQYLEICLYGESEANYRLLKARLDAEGGDDWVLMPLVPYSPIESAQDRIERGIKEQYAKGDFSADRVGAPKTEEEKAAEAKEAEAGYAGDDEEYMGDDEEYMGDEEDYAESFTEELTGAELATLIEESPPFPPTKEHWIGTDDRGRDVLVRLAYGFNVSLTFAMILTATAYALGIALGSVLGYYGGRIDLFGQRVIEIWQTIPFLFTVMILGAALSGILTYEPELPNILQPQFLLLVIIMVTFGWMAMTYYVRGEFLREKAKDYVAAAIAIGTSDRTIIFKHILPNSLVPVVTYAPFTIVGGIASLVALDYLGFGLPAPTPSWGEMMKQALPEHTKAWWLAGTPILALFLTLLLVVFVGEAVREAFDPKVHSRLR